MIEEAWSYRTRSWLLMLRTRRAGIMAKRDAGIL